MCTFALTLDDKLVERVKPAFKSEKAMNEWLQAQMELLLRKKVSKTSSKKQKEKLSPEEFLKKLQELEGDKDGFVKMIELLPPSKISTEELLNEYYEEKYGI